MTIEQEVIEQDVIKQDVTRQDVVIKRPGQVLSPPAGEGQRYVLAGNGLFLERRTGLYSTTAWVRTFPAGLADHRESCVLHFGRLSAFLGRVMMAFFRRAYALHGGEAVLLLLYHPLRRRFRWYCPRQTIEMRQGYYGGWYTSYEIRYDEPDALPPGYVTLGDAHSHAWMPARASHTDVHEEKYKDGLHIIAGRLDRGEPELHVEFVMDQRRFRVDPGQVFEELSFAPVSRIPERWERRIVIERVYWNR